MGINEDEDDCCGGLLWGFIFIGREEFVFFLKVIEFRFSCCFVFVELCVFGDILFDIFFWSCCFIVFL